MYSFSCIAVKNELGQTSKSVIFKDLFGMHLVSKFGKRTRLPLKLVLLKLWVFDGTIELVLLRRGLDQRPT